VAAEGRAAGVPTSASASAGAGGAAGVAARQAPPAAPGWCGAGLRAAGVAAGCGLRGSARRCAAATRLAMWGGSLSAGSGVPSSPSSKAAMLRHHGQPACVATVNPLSVQQMAASALERSPPPPPPTHTRSRTCSSSRARRQRGSGRPGTRPGL
jgi:hypothetical protein